MKRVALTSLLLAAGCTGNWSNADLEFVSALPVKSELQSKIPTRTGSPLNGEGTRRDPLGIGQPAQSYLDAKKASTDFNALLDGLLTIVEYIRTLPPTSRTKDSRTWGPFSDDKNQGYESRLVITRIDAQHFEWHIQSHLKTSGEDAWFDVAVGNFQATGGIRKGKGRVELFIAENVSKLKTLEAFGPVAHITTGYITDTDPLQVNMTFTFSANDAGYSELGYGYQENGDKAGKINFGLRTLDPNVLFLDTTAGWLPSGAGKATALVTEGNYKNAQSTECWDTSFNTTYAFQNWPGGVNIGDPASCATLPF
jgi:hypothetical protein